MEDCGIGGVVSGGITVLCGNIHTTAHGESDAFCRVVLTCGQGRPTVKHFAIGHCGLVQRHGHCCAFRYRVGLFVAGHVRDNVQRLAAFFHGSSAAGYGQGVVDRSPTGIEGGVLRNCGIFYIKELAIFELAICELAICGVPAGESVTRTGGLRDGIRIVCFQFICLGISDFFGLINRHHSLVGQVAIVVVQFAAIGIKGHLAEVKKIAVCQYMMAFRLIIWVITQTLCGGLVVVVVDGTIFGRLLCKSSRATNQTVFERSQSSRERNVFQTEAPSKGIRFNGFYFFWDGDVRQSLAFFKGILADRLNILT